MSGLVSFHLSFLHFRTSLPFIIANTTFSEATTLDAALVPYSFKTSRQKQTERTEDVAARRQQFVYTEYLPGNVTYVQILFIGRSSSIRVRLFARDGFDRFGP